MAFSKRKLTNVKLTKRFQIKYYGWWFVVSIFLIAVLSVCLWLLFEQSWLEVVAQDPGQAGDYLATRGHYVPMLVLMAFFMLIGITGLGIMTTHRIAGPLIKLQRAFDEIKEGNFDYRLQFRQEDDLADLAASFNEMMDRLREEKKTLKG